MPPTRLLGFLAVWFISANTAPAFHGPRPLLSASLYRSFLRVNGYMSPRVCPRSHRTAAQSTGEEATPEKDLEVDYFFADGFSSLLDDSKNNAERGPKSPFEGGQTILLGSEDERAPVTELPRQATSPPPPPISRRGIPPSPSSGGSVNDNKSGMRGRREGKRPKRFAPPWQQGSSSNFADGPGGSGRRSRRAPGGATAEGGFIPSSPPPSAGRGQGPQGNGTPPPTRVYRPPGTFDLEPGRGGRGGSGGGGSAREREDQQIFRLLNVFGNPNGMLFGAVALALGTVAFGWAWKSGALENSSPGQAMLQDPEATAYMSREAFPQDVDVTVTLDDKVINLSQEGDVDIL